MPAIYLPYATFAESVYSMYDYQTDLLLACCWAWFLL